MSNTIVTNSSSVPVFNTDLMYDQLGSVVQAVKSGTDGYLRLRQIIAGMDLEDRILISITEKLDSLVNETLHMEKLLIKLVTASEKSKAALVTESSLLNREALKWFVQFVRAHSQKEQDDLAPLVTGLQRALVPIDILRQEKINSAAKMEETLEVVRKQLRKPIQNVEVSTNVGLDVEPFESVQELLNKAKFEVLSKE